MHLNPQDIIEPLVVSPARAKVMLDCGTTRLYELIDAGELESFKDGKSRKITVSSIKARIERKLAESRGAMMRHALQHRGWPKSAQ
jgi:hypothetical protein